MSRYLVMFFIENRILQYGLDELINNTVNGYLIRSVIPSDVNILFPINIDNNECYISPKFKNWRIVVADEEITKETEIGHGSYIKFNSKRISYSVLILDIKKQSLNAVCYELGNGQNVFLGRNPDSNIVLNTNNSISRKHAAIRIDSAGNGYIEDLSRNAGVFLNGKRVVSSKLSCGDIIQIMGNTICFMDSFLVVPKSIKTNDLVEVRSFDLTEPVDDVEIETYVRTPRILKSIDKGKIVIDAPTQPQRSKQIPFILSVGPSATMAFGMLASFGVTLSNALNGGNISSLITGGVMVISMLLGALMWPSLLRNYNKRQEEINEKYRREKYGCYLLEREEEIKKSYNRNSRIWNENLLPDIRSLSKIVFDRSINLWEKTNIDDDFLEIRLGVGTRLFENEIQAPQKGFTLYDDPLIDMARKLADKYKYLNNVPVSVSLLKKRIIGIVGTENNIENIIRCMIVNLAVMHSPEDVKICILCNKLQSQRFEWVKLIPHCWNSSRELRYFATNISEAYRLLNDIDEKIQERETLLSKDDIRTPHIVFFILDNDMVSNVPLYRYLTNQDNNVGISSIFARTLFNQIPKECETIIQHERDICGIYIKNENKNRFLTFEPDILSTLEIKQLSRSMASIPIRVDSSQLSIPSRISFLDMYKVGNVKDLNIEQRWNNNTSEKSLAVPLGVKAGGELFSLDIHEKYHGCHGLVAGMTGSGKSEFLQAYILSAMINYSPNEIAFVLVDFKGGDMARPFLKTPHLSATISNLSGNVLYRALISLEAEIKSRQLIFNDSAGMLGIDKIDINSYHKFFKEGKLTRPLPHLVIIIDEFAQLKSQQPEFMARLVEIAQVGRSLGIHLILATQRPSGVVDPQIWSNSRFKVCLKVLDRQDSIEMINRPDAAMIKIPGRAYIQVGYDEIFEQMQSGYSGADYIPQNDYVNEEEVTVKMIDSAAMSLRTARVTVGSVKSGKTQLEESIGEIIGIGRKRGIRVKPLWLEPLSDHIILSDCMNIYTSDIIGHWDSDKELNAVCGMIDIIETQEQIPLSISLVKKGHIAIYGASGTGKTTLLHTILFSLVNRYSPEMLNIFALDFGGRNLGAIAKTPHCVNVAYADDEDKISYIFEQVNQCIEQRKYLFANNNCGTYEAYLAATNEKLPAVVIVLDNYAMFREKMFKYEDDLVQIIANSKSYGIYLIITGNSKNAIYYKAAEHISNNITLKMNDHMNYRDILNISVPIEPENKKGRGLTVYNKRVVEFQAALAVDAENDSESMDKIIEIYSDIEKHYKGVRAADFHAGIQRRNSNGVGRQNTENNAGSENKKKISVLAPIKDDSHSIICGTSVISGDLQGFQLSEVQNVFIGLREGYYPDRFIKRIYAMENTMIYDFGEDVQQAENIKSVTTESQIHEMIVYLKKILSERIIELQMIRTANISNEDIYGYMQQHKRIIILIRSFEKFYDMISDDDLKEFQTLIKDSKQTGIYIITLADMEKMIPYSDTALYIELVKTEKGMIIGGDIDDTMAARLCGKFGLIPVSERKKHLPEDQAFMYDESEWSVVSID